MGKQLWLVQTQHWKFIHIHLTKQTRSNLELFLLLKTNDQYFVFIKRLMDPIDEFESTILKWKKITMNVNNNEKSLPHLRN